MKEFKLSSKTIVKIDDKKVIIYRSEENSSSRLAGGAKGKVIIKLSAIAGMIKYADYLLICASGMPTPHEFSSCNVVKIKQYPNCIVGQKEELAEIFDYLNELI